MMNRMMMNFLRRNRMRIPTRRNCCCFWISILKIRCYRMICFPNCRKARKMILTSFFWKAPNSCYAGCCLMNPICSVMENRKMSLFFRCSEGLSYSSGLLRASKYQQNCYSCCYYTG
jgi:hypothetical protein